MPQSARLTRRGWLGGLAAAALGALPARATQYPTGLTVKVVVGYPPGGTSDVVGRIVADRLAAAWGVPVIVENVAGANGNIGNERVAKGSADGTQLLIVTANIASRLGYDPARDFIPISCVARLPNLLLVKNGLPVNSVAELIGHARANPGKLNYGSPGVGSSPQLAAEIFKRMTGTEIVPVGYRGSAPALNDLVAGSIDLMFDNITSSINLARGGRIRVLGVTSEQRTPLAPDFPTIAETVPGYDVSTFFGVVVRAGTPPDVVAKIETAVVALAQEPAAKERLAGVSAEAVGSSAEDFTQFLASERSRWGQLITELGIRIE